MMLCIEPVRDRQRLEGLFEQAGLDLPAFPFGVELSLGNQAAFGLFEIDPHAASIGVLYASAPDTALLDAVVRAGISAGEQMGCGEFDLSAKMPPDMLGRLTPLGYAPGPRQIEEFFSHCPGGCSGSLGE